MVSGDCFKRVTIKLFEIGINVICVVLVLKYNCVPTKNLFSGSSFSDFFNEDFTRTYFAVAVVGGFFVISTVTLLAYGFEGMSKAPILETLMMIAGAALSVTAGGFVLEYFANAGKGTVRDAGLGFGSLQILNGLVYLVDAFFVYKK